MRMSELIAELQELEKEIPFDAEVVIGEFGPFMQRLKRVYHRPPVTVLEFEERDDEGGDS